MFAGTQLQGNITGGGGMRGSRDQPMIVQVFLDGQQMTNAMTKVIVRDQAAFT